MKGDSGMRKITCVECGAMKPTPPEDAAMGLFERRVYGKSIRSLVCDYCGTPLNPGDNVIALSLPQNMAEWEGDYLNECGDANCPLHSRYPNTCVASPQCSRGLNFVRD